MVTAFREAWLSVPGKITDHPGDAYRTAAQVMAASEPLLEAVKTRQEAEIERDHGDRAVPKAVSERQQRELSRAGDAG